MAQTLIAKEKAPNHEDMVNIFESLRNMNKGINAIAEKMGVQTIFHDVMRITEGESGSDAMVTYVEGSSGKLPAKMDYTNSRFDYGSWKNAWFMPRPCMVKYDGTVDYYLDPDDYTKKEDGTASDVDDLTYAGNAMMEWGNDNGKIWYKIVPTNTTYGADVHFSNVQLDDDYVAYSFINMEGEYTDHFYTPIYGGSNDSNSRLRSISGQALNSGKTASTERTACKANGTGWDMESFCDRVLLSLLGMLMAKSTDFKTAFGNGIITGSQTAKDNYVTGAGDALGLFFGYSDQTHVVKFFGMENFWGLQWHRTNGLILSNGTQLAKLCYGQSDGSTTDDYNLDGTGYITIADSTPTGSSGGYINVMKYDHNAFFAKTVSGSSTTYYRAGCWFSTSGVRFALFGGASSDGVRCSALYVNLGYGASSAFWYFSAAPSLKPSI